MVASKLAELGGAAAVHPFADDDLADAAARDAAAASAESPPASAEASPASP
jgi:hypothetical protein